MLQQDREIGDCGTYHAAKACEIIGPQLAGSAARSLTDVVAAGQLLADSTDSGELSLHAFAVGCVFCLQRPGQAV
jgi:hypothetical protein